MIPARVASRVAARVQTLSRVLALMDDGAAARKKDAIACPYAEETNDWRWWNEGWRQQDQKMTS